MSDINLIPCPGWEYDQLPNVDAILKSRTEAALTIISKKTTSELIQVAKDTRIFHQQLFVGLTPSQTPYYAGHYRGEDFYCLKSYQVGIQSDPRVGHSAEYVPPRMAALAADIENSIKVCVEAYRVPNSIFSPEEKLLKTINVAAAIFVYFLEIHPFANGNGHAGRFVLISVLARFGIHLTRWNIHPRPPDPPYSQAIAQYRSGNRALLEQFILSCI